MFKANKAEVENQLKKIIKCIRFDYDGEYYDKHDILGRQHLETFVKFLEKYIIAPRYTVYFSMNDFAERLNRTPKNMMKNMISHSILIESFWGEALNITSYIINKMPTKVKITTSYKFWMSKTPSLKYLYIQGCITNARPYKPIEKNMDSVIPNCYFIDYSE